MELSVILI